jgi:hypothetical protein
MLGGVHGSDERVVYADLCQAVDEWISLHETEGRQLPRSTSLRKSKRSSEFIIKGEQNRTAQPSAVSLGFGPPKGQGCRVYMA